MAEVLRYPYEAITSSTDYLQITVKKYEAGDMLTTPSATPFSSEDVGATLSANLYKQTLVNDGGIILLPMPSNIQDSNSVSYEEGSLDTFSAIGVERAQEMMMQDFRQPGGVAKVLGNIADTSVDAIKGLQDAGIKELMLKALASQAVSVFGGNITVNQMLARSEGKTLNPNMELLFNGVSLRSFRFSFKMTPRNRNESLQVKKIIRSFKRNMAANAADAFLLAPNIFQLEYRRGNSRHPFLHRFKPCALSDMSINYTGDNVYAVYDDSTPVSLVMDLTFKELVPIYQQDYDSSQEGTILESDSSVGY